MTDSQLIGAGLVFYIFCIHPLLYFFALTALINWWRGRLNHWSGKSVWAALTNPPDPTVKPKEL